MSVYEETMDCLLEPHSRQIKRLNLLFPNVEIALWTEQGGEAREMQEQPWSPRRIASHEPSYSAVYMIQTIYGTRETKGGSSARYAGHAGTENAHSGPFAR